MFSLHQENFPILEKGRSVVKLLSDSTNNKKYAVKLVPLENKSLQKEFDLLGKINHPNIIRPIEFGKNVRENYLITEYMDYGDLFNFITINDSKLYTRGFLNHRSFEKFWRTLFSQCLASLIYLRSLGWAHLDVKPENFLINSWFEIKLIDFEFAFEIDKTRSNQNQCDKYCGSKSYFSPEIKERKMPYDPMKSDVFSLGVTMINLMTRIDIFSDNGLGFNKQYRCIRSGSFEKFWQSLPFSLFFSKDLKDVFENMLKYNPNERISLENLCQYKWFQGETFSKGEIVVFFKNMNFLNKCEDFKKVDDDAIGDSASKKIKTDVQN